MYKVYLENEKGQTFTKEFESPYLMNKFLNKVKRSKKIKYLGKVKLW